MFPSARRIAPIEIPAANIKFQIFIHKQNSEKTRTFPPVCLFHQPHRAHLHRGSSF